MIPKNLPVGLKEYICMGFDLIHKSDELKYQKKVDMLGNLFSLGAGTGWRPKAITLGALKLFASNNFNLPKGLERAHEHHRRDTFKILLETDWNNDEWWDWFVERDYTTLATRSENRKESSFESLTIFNIPLELNLFWGKRVGFEYREPEKLFIKNLASKHL